MGQVVSSLEDLRVRKPYSVELPNRFNLVFSLYTIAAGGILFYLPGTGCRPSPETHCGASLTPPTPAQGAT